MSQRISKTITYLSIITIVIGAIFLANGLILAWSPPTALPPDPNVPTPLNVGSTGQSKAGGLILNTGGAVIGLVVDQGNVGIGTVNPIANLHIAGILPAIRVSQTDSVFQMIADSIGGTLQTLTSGAEIRFMPDIGVEAMRIDSSGNVGIGTKKPGHKLVVDGAVSATTYYGDGSNLTGVSGSSGGGGNYVDRGDPASHDFRVGDIIADNTWHDLNLSSIVPVDATAVHLRVEIRHALTGAAIDFRKNGNSNTKNAARVGPIQVSHNYMWGDIIVSCDTNRIIEYVATNVPWTVINITVAGWWM